jgi:acetate---CoA ligase (ADP-forming) subunit beta
MVSKEIQDILNLAKETGWVMEPEAKRLLAMAGISVPTFCLVNSPGEAENFVNAHGYPVAAKVVSKKVLHKSDVGGVVVGIDRKALLTETFETFSRIPGFEGMLIEEMVSGIELIVGAKIDYQFGPIILLGIGGTGVEIYRDITVRMAPIEERDVGGMVKSLKARRLLEGYRGKDPIDFTALTHLLLAFSDLVMALETIIESIDLNPVMCTKDTCIVADARIMLKPSQ